jgi:hypothetical protein
MVELSTLNRQVRGSTPRGTTNLLNEGSEATVGCVAPLCKSGLKKHRRFNSFLAHHFFSPLSANGQANRLSSGLSGFEFP